MNDGLPVEPKVAGGPWRVSTVADICEMRNGHGFGPDDWSDAGLPIIRIQNLNGGKSFDYFAGEPDPRWLVEPGQLLFAWAGTKGVSFGPTVWRGPLGVLNQHIFKVYPKEGIDPDWLYWALRHVTDRIEGSAHGFKATLVHVKKSDIDRQVVHVPPRGEQRRIARMLAAWDQAEAVSASLVRSSTSLARSIGITTLLGRRRLGGRKFTAIAQRFTANLPDGWRPVRIADIAREINLRQGAELSYPVLSCTKHDGLVDSLSYFNKQVFSADTSTYKVVPRGCFAYATNHIEEGSIGHQKLYDFGVVSPMYTVFETTEQICHEYLFALLKTEHYRQIFASATNASVDRRGSLRWRDFGKLDIPLPPISEQREIATLLQTASIEVTKRQAHLKCLREEKAALMADLLTGKRRVRLPASETTP